MYCSQGGKYRDISVIYRVLGGVDMIFHGEISVRRYFARNPKKSAISIFEIQTTNHPGKLTFAI